MLLLRSFVFLCAGIFGFAKSASYGVMRADLHCYNCTWNRKSNSTSWEKVPTAGDICRQDVCTAALDGVCVKDVATKDGIVMAVRRFCATSNEVQGCFARDEVDGMKRTMCLCNDWHYCNSAKSLSVNNDFYIVVFIYSIYAVFGTSLRRSTQDGST